MGGGVAQGLHPVVGPVDLPLVEEDRPHRHLPLPEGEAGLLQGQAHGGLRLAVDLHHPLPLGPDGPKRPQLLGKAHRGQDLHQPLPRGQAVAGPGAAEARGEGEARLLWDEEEDPGLPAGQNPLGKGGRPSPQGPLQKLQKPGLGPEAQPLQDPP
ncbi:hypothetical protein THFILI_03385 [Thermus filiformis]|uniref:Uncharacterized protein n=1 Tax=Thermus filiformis TaxID=276 RepID=A0A0D6X9T9_THEFI|nr:hypothetical protein THFILI_03385 [Thermus filiformis]